MECDEFLCDGIDEEGVVFRQGIARWEAELVDIEIVRSRWQGAEWRREYRSRLRVVLVCMRIWRFGSDVPGPVLFEEVMRHVEAGGESGTWLRESL